MRPLRGFRPDGTYDLTEDFDVDDGAEPALILLADRMCDTLEASVMAVCDLRATQVDMAYVTDLGATAGWYVAGTHRRPTVVMNAPVIAGSDDPVAAIASLLAQAVSRSWREQRHGRADADEEARVYAAAYRQLIDVAAPWRGSSLPDVT